MSGLDEQIVSTNTCQRRAGIFASSQETWKEHWQKSKKRRNVARLAEDVKAVELGKQLHEGALDLAVRACALAEAAAPDRIDFVHEDDARLVLPRIAKHLAHQPCALADILIHDRARNDL